MFKNSRQENERLARLAELNNQLFFPPEHRARVEVISLPGERMELIIRSTDEDWAHLKRRWLTVEGDLNRLGFIDTTQTTANTRGISSQQEQTTHEPMSSGKQRESSPTVKTETRFEVFERIKTKNPEFTQEQVAEEAKIELEDNYINGETVRNVYRAMGKQWPERGERRPGNR